MTTTDESHKCFGCARKENSVKILQHLSQVLATGLNDRRGYRQRVSWGTGSRYQRPGRSDDCPRIRSSSALVGSSDELQGGWKAVLEGEANSN